MTEVKKPRKPRLRKITETDAKVRANVGKILTVELATEILKITEWAINKDINAPHPDGELISKIIKAYYDWLDINDKPKQNATKTDAENGYSVITFIRKNFDGRLKFTENPDELVLTFWKAFLLFRLTLTKQYFTSRCKLSQIVSDLPDMLALAKLEKKNNNGNNTTKEQRLADTANAFAEHYKAKSATERI